MSNHSVKILRIKLEDIRKLSEQLEDKSLLNAVCKLEEALQKNRRYFVRLYGFN